MTTQPDLQARYLVSLLDVLADEASIGASTPRIRSLANSAAHIARQLTDTLSDRAGSSAERHLPRHGGNVIVFPQAR